MASDFATDPTTLASHGADVSYAERITDEVLAALMANVVTPALLRQENLAGQPTKSVKITKADKFTAASVAEGVETTNTPLTTDSVTGTAAEIAIQATVSDVLNLSDIPAAHPARLQQLGRALGDKIDIDIASLFQGFSTAVGASGMAAELADILDAIYNIEVNDASGLGALVGVLHPDQSSDIRDDVITQNASVFHNASGDARQGSQVLAMQGPGMFGEWMGVNLFQTTNVPGDGTDRQGGIFVRDYALAQVKKYDARVEPLRWPPIRGWVLVASAMYGVFEVEDAAGVAWATAQV